MAQQNSATPYVRWQLSRIPASLVFCLCSLALSSQGCAEKGGQESASQGGVVEAVEIWAHPDTVEHPPVYVPLDFKAESRTVVWAIDGVARGVRRYEPSKGESLVFGYGENPPVEVVMPARLAVSENAGVFVFDESTGMLDQYSPGGQHLRGFDLGIRPSILEVAPRPPRLTFGVRAFADDTIPTLVVIQTDFLGQNADTLLSPNAGPESLRATPALGGRLISTPATSGLWVFATAMSDTVFEVSGTGPSRKLALPETDTLRAGVLADLQQEILWMITPLPMGGLDYEAYDISSDGNHGIIDGSQAYLGARTTPRFFSAKVAFDGSVSGWWRADRGVFAPKGYDMRIDDLREGAAGARQTREVRRAASADLWVRTLQAQEEAEEEARRARGHDRRGLLARRLLQDLGERCTTRGGDLRAGRVRGDRRVSNDADVDQVRLAAVRLDTVADIARLGALRVEGRQHRDGLHAPTLPPKRRPANSFAVASTAFSIGMRSVELPVQMPWPEVWLSMYWASSGVSSAAPWPISFTSGWILRAAW